MTVELVERAPGVLDILGRAGAIVPSADALALTERFRDAWGSVTDVERPSNDSGLLSATLRTTVRRRR